MAFDAARNRFAIVNGNALTVVEFDHNPLRKQ